MPFSGPGAGGTEVAPERPVNHKPQSDREKPGPGPVRDEGWDTSRLCLPGRYRASRFLLVQRLFQS